MNRKTFNNLIQTANFRELFITEMGWNNPLGNSHLPLITIDEVNYDICCIAQRNGFQILTCKVLSIPTVSICRKIDIKLRRQANDYICIYLIPDSNHHEWVAPVKTNEKRELVLIEYATLEQSDFLFSKISDLTFGLDEVTTIMDVRERIQGTFAVNSEKITKDFYSGFKKEHSAFVDFITGIDDDILSKENKNKQWYTSVMLNRLMFCYFIQKKGFLDNDTDYLRNKLNWVQKEEGEDRFYSSFYRGFLVQLFHDGLNASNHNHEFERIYGRIPYLNGGMFDKHQLEQQYADIDISDEAFVRLFDFFDTWQWHLDTRITASGKDINPDVLGYIFEQYINDRSAMGAYYTKEDITEYIGKNCIIPFLMDKVAESSSRDFKPDGYVWQTVKQSGGRYIYEAVKKGYTKDWTERIPDYIFKGIDVTTPDLLDRRSRWNEKSFEEFALPTEIWRETIERLQRCDNLLLKIDNGEIQQINDFITYNLDIRQFAYDLLLNATDHRFIGCFYHALQSVSVLDPTCGSGAFLFAAMNILEPLYEVCISRMQEYNEQNPFLFKEELAEIANKYRSNIQYFIYKSIILRNLYGVDIMVEATEIAKLRLFLKMVAVVEVDKRAENMGLDPLPDVDFNIRCGNTLVGYANEEELNRDLNYGDMFANDEFKTNIEQKMDVVARTYDIFKEVQLNQKEERTNYKEAKEELKIRLAELDELLNHHLYKASSDVSTYDKWLSSHQPFHWLAEFYQIIHDKGGFDVIIGNPPYVENTKVKNYKLTDYDTISCGNVYALVYERSLRIVRDKSYVGMIVQLPIACTDRMEAAQNLLLERTSYILTFDDRPGKLFDDLQHIRVTIFLSMNKGKQLYTSKYNRWYSECRSNLFNNLSIIKSKTINNIRSLPKVGNGLAYSIIDKILKHNLMSRYYNLIPGYQIYTHNAPQYFTRATTFVPYFWNEVDGKKLSVSIKGYVFKTKEESDIACCVLNSSIFYFWFIILSDCRHLNAREIDNFPINMTEMPKTLNDKFSFLSNALMSDFVKNKNQKVSFYKSTGKVIYDEYFPKLSKPIIDEIDKVLAKHYGFTDEELDFIINYDIKYRMGDELSDKERLAKH